MAAYLDTRDLHKELEELRDNKKTYDEYCKEVDECEQAIAGIELKLDDLDTELDNLRSEGGYGVVGVHIYVSPETADRGAEVEAEIAELKEDLFEKRQELHLAEIYRDRCAADDPEEADERIKVLEELENEMDERAFRDGVTMIPESEFEDYARDLAEDIGAIQRDMDWPCNYIDWEAAANALRSDFTEVEFDGTTYLFRE